MKKLLIILFTLPCFIFASCKDKDFCFDRISQLRENVFFASTQTFDLKCNAEIREDPFLSDGYVGNSKNYLIFNLTYKCQAQPDGVIKITFSFDKKSYLGKFEFTPLSPTLTCIVEVHSLPKENFGATIEIEKKRHDLVLTSLKKSDSLTPDKVMQILKTNDNQNLRSIFENIQSYEIRLRLIENDGYNYWYVGFTSKQKTYSFLLDAFSGEIIAVKS